MKGWISVEEVDMWVDAFESAGTKSDKDIEEVLKDVSSYFRALLRGRTYPVKQASVQDSKPPKKMSGNKPVTARVSGHQAEVEIREYWARARNSSVREAMIAAGLGSELVRDSLWLDPNQRRGPNKKEFKFSQHGLIRHWAQQGQAPLDYQYHRHAVNLPVRALYHLAVDPAIDYGEDKINQKLEMVSRLFVEAAAA